MFHAFLISECVREEAPEGWNAGKNLHQRMDSGWKARTAEEECGSAAGR
jgi:hypothetical protein